MEGYFGRNLELALLSKGIKQVKFAESLGVAKSAVNKWTKGAVKPDEARWERIEELLGLSYEELDQVHPMVLGERLGLTRRQVQWQLGDVSSSIPLSNENFSSLPSDYLMKAACGLFVVYMPSWAYKDVICQRALSIKYDKDGYYFKERHRFFEELGETEYIGQVGRSENSIQLIGEEANRIKHGYSRPSEIIFASLKLSGGPMNADLLGLCLGADTVDGGHSPIASPYLAVRHKEASCLEEIVPAEPYIHVEKLDNPIVLGKLKSVRQGWLASTAEWPAQEIKLPD